MIADKLLGRLPDKRASLVIASGEYPELTESLRDWSMPNHNNF